MIQLCAIIEVRSFSALERFEMEVKTIMLEHGRRVISAFETRRELNGSGEEVHFLEFESNEGFESYKSDPRMIELSELRKLAISKIEVKKSERLKSY